MYRTAQFFVIWFFRLYYGFSVKGREHLPREGGYILASSHQSFIDPFIIACPVPHYVCFMARDTLWKSRIYRFGHWLFRNSIPVKRGMPDKTAMRNAMDRFALGWVILLFPEGTRTVDGNLGEIKRGPSFIAEKTNAPIVPAVIKGAHGIWPKGRLIPRLLPWPFHKLKVRYGEPIRLEDFKEYTGRDFSIKITEVLEQRMQALFDAD